MASPSRKPTFSQYQLRPFCGGCGRKLVAKNEPAMWFRGSPSRAVFGVCCWTQGAHTNHQEREAA